MIQDVSPNILTTISRPSQIFLHFFDVHFLEDKGKAAENPAFQREMLLATRLAVASADGVLVPAASYLESSACRIILDDLSDLVDYGLIQLVGSSTNIEEFVRERQDENFYPIGSAQHGYYRQQLNSKPLPSYHRRQRSTTKDIINRWTYRVQNEDLQRGIRDALGGISESLENRLERVPEELGGLAFIPEHVYKILDIKTSSRLVCTRIRSVINEAYFESYLRELGAGVVDDLKHLSSDFKMPSYGQNISYAKMLRFLIMEGRLNEVLSCDPFQLIAMGKHPNWQQAILSSVTRVVAPPSAYTIDSEIKTKMIDNKPTSTFRVLCIVAAPSEMRAVQNKFNEVFGSGRTARTEREGGRFVRRYVDPENGVIWDVASPDFQGQMDMASLVPKLTQSLTPNLTLMVGMCMGMPKRNHKIGTVIVPNEVTSFDHSRTTKKGILPRPHSMRVTQSSIYSLVRIFDFSSLEYVVVADKGLASASTKIEDPEANLIQLIEAAFPDVTAFDMEGGGFYSGNFEHECLWIKSVADNGESQEQTSNAQDEKHATQINSTANAADFAIRLVREYYSAESPD